MKTKEIKSIMELNQLVLENISKLEVGKISIPKANAVSNLVGKSIAISNTKVAYHRLLGLKTPIPFIES